MAKKKGIRLSQDSQEALLRLAREIQEKQQDNSDFIDKLETIDTAYAKSKIALSKVEDRLKAGEALDDALVVPIVASEVDTISAELVSMFLSKYPLFGVVAQEGNNADALKLQSLISRDARYQRWARQLVRFIKQAVRYNVAGIEVANVWKQDITYLGENETPEQDIAKDVVQATALYTPDIYNSLFDYRVSPADICTEGEYAGYNRIISRTAFKRLANALSVNSYAYNLHNAFKTNSASAANYWNQHPDISEYISVTQQDENDQDWFSWFNILGDSELQLTASDYFYTRLYVRIIPKEFGIYSSNHPIIARVEFINMEYLISYQEILSPMDTLPMMFADLREDDFNLQTKSVAENVLPYQQIATKLLHARLEGSKRAISDRAIYDPNYIDPTDVNTKQPAPKIPLKQSLYNAEGNIPIGNVYQTVPFDAQGVINALTDLNTIMALKDEVNGINFARRGEQRPGNRTLGEFSVLDAASNKKVLPLALMLEDQVFTYLKLHIKHLVLSGDRSEYQVIDYQTGKVQEVNIVELRSAMLDFRVTDGLQPKRAIQNPEVLTMALQYMQNSQEFNQMYDSSGVFEDMMALYDFDVSKRRRQNDNTAEPTNREVQSDGNNPSGGSPS